MVSKPFAARPARDAGVPGFANQETSGRRTDLRNKTHPSLDPIQQRGLDCFLETKPATPPSSASPLALPRRADVRPGPLSDRALPPRGRPTWTEIRVRPA